MNQVTGRTGVSKKPSLRHWPSRPFARWSLAASIAFVLAASSTPSPIYIDYQTEWRLSAATITAVYAVYSIGVLAELLLFGPLSDRVGRRPVLAISMGSLLFALVLLLLASGPVWLFLARAVQGLATGMFTGAAGAAIGESSPHISTSQAGRTNSASQSLGIASGALISGALAQWTPYPLRAPYLVLIALGGLLQVALLVFVNETVPARSRGSASRQIFRLQRLSVPSACRSPFALAALGVTCAWAAAGVYLGLGGSLTKSLLGVNNHLIIGLVIVSVQGVGGAAQIALHKLDDRTALIMGGSSLALGAGLTTLAIYTATPVAFFIGNTVAGAGFGLTFLGATRLVSAVAPPERRSEVIAAYFVVAYVAISVPALSVGVVSVVIGLSTTFYCFAATLVVLGLSTSIAASQMSFGKDH